MLDTVEILGLPSQRFRTGKQTERKRMERKNREKEDFAGKRRKILLDASYQGK